MNTTAKSALWLALSALFACGPLAPACEEGFRISNGEEGWPVVFEDAGLDEREKCEIAVDYGEILSRLKPSGSHESTLGSKKIRRMLYTSSQWHWPASASGLI